MSNPVEIRMRPDDPSMAAPEAYYSLRGLKKSYTVPSGQKLCILDGLDLEIRRGEFLVIQGRSGIGKSTLLHIMGLLDRPDSGQILLEGEDLAGATRSRRAQLRNIKISFVFQFFYLLPEFTAIENVMLAGQIDRGFFGWRKFRARARRIAMDLLDSVGVADRATHRPNQLSGGERQRVALARALFNEPAIVLCDEPTGNLDVETAEEMQQLLVRLNHERGQTMVVVTHDAEMAGYAGRVVKLENRRIVEP